MTKAASLLLLFLPLSVWAQKADFAAAERYDAPNLRKQVGNLQIIPFFLNQKHAFWFRSDTPGQDPVYYLVEPFKKKKMVLFDKQAIKLQLEKLLGKPIDEKSVIYRPEFAADGQTVEVGYKGGNYAYDYEARKLLSKAAKKDGKKVVYYTGALSPDRKWLLYARHHNLYLQHLTDSAEKALTADGAENFTFSINNADEFSNRNTGTNASWTPDSRYFYVLREDSRKVETMTVTNSLGKPRPYVNTYKFETPGDKYVPQYEFFIGDPASKTLKKINIEHWPDQEVEVLPKQSNNQEVFLLRKKRSRDEMELCAVNLQTGALRVVIHEISKPIINRDLFQLYLLDGGKDILWWSDRSGWGQYYHYDISGKLKGVLGGGNWTAGKIVAIDSAKRIVYFYGYGKETGRNPNYSFLYKGQLSNGKVSLLTPENANHTVHMAPDNNYFVDQFSRIDLEPKAVLRKTTGAFVQDVFKPDLKQLYAYGWRAPEMFTVKAADGQTDLYGLMWKPFNFDPNKKYPVISQVYPGPFTETVWNDFTVFDRYNNTSLAQVGFIVVVMGHRGGSPYRNAAYYKYGHGNLRDYPLADDKFGLEQLGRRFNYMDTTKIGIYGHSGGGMMSAAALGTYPDFYKAAVSSSGNHDNTIYRRHWGESYQGFEKPYDLNQSLAKNIKGPLLLVAGESDENVNPAATMRMVNALILANKDFELLMLPGQHHTYEAPYKQYYESRTRKFFAKYLMEEM